MGVRTYLYKLTSDRGGAPCAPMPRAGAAPLLTLSICKPAIRRTAQVGDRILGVSSQSLAVREGYPLGAVIYAAVVTGAVDAREYYAARSPFRSRPDCIYRFHREMGTLTHTGRTGLHADAAYEARDIGRYPFYRNGRTLLSAEFRYFGPEAVVLPEQFGRLRRVSEELGQGHRVFGAESPEAGEIEGLFRELWGRETRFSPGVVNTEAYGHAPRAPKEKRPVPGGLGRC